MNWTVKLSSRAEKYFRRLDKETRERLTTELVVMGSLENPLSHGDVRPLTGELRGFNRLRVGSYRIIFSLLRETKTIAVVNLVPRGDAYK